MNFDANVVAQNGAAPIAYNRGYQYLHADVPLHRSQCGWNRDLDYRAGCEAEGN